jgi:hypothetical protein
LFKSFLEACQDLRVDAFLNKKTRRFNMALYEAAFAVGCEAAFEGRRMLTDRIASERLIQLESDPEFLKASLEGTTSTANVKKRLERARIILGTR